MTRAIESTIENYLCGNLTDAKKKAKRIAWPNLYAALRKYGRGEKEAEAITDYLKGRGTFQAACDAGTTKTKS
jgi:hypothetical protein